MRIPTEGSMRYHWMPYSQQTTSKVILQVIECHPYFATFTLTSSGDFPLVTFVVLVYVWLD